MLTRFRVANVGGFRMGGAEISPIVASGILDDLVYAGTYDNANHCLIAGGEGPIWGSAIQELRAAVDGSRFATLTTEQKAAIDKFEACVLNTRTTITPGATEYAPTGANISPQGMKEAIPTWAYVAGGAAALGLVAYLVSK